MIVIVTPDNATWKTISQGIRERMPCAVVYRYDERHAESLFALIAEVPHLILYNPDGMSREICKTVQERMTGKPFEMVNVFDPELDVETIVHHATRHVGESKNPMNRVWRDKAAAVDLKSKLLDLKALAARTLKLYAADGEVTLGEPVDLSIQGAVIAVNDHELVSLTAGSFNTRRSRNLEDIPIEDLLLLIAAVEKHHKTLEAGKHRSEQKPRPNITPATALPEAPDDDLPF